MRTIYIDSEFKCHTINDGTMKAAETDFFDGKCDEFINGYRFIPDGESWMREDGVLFTGGMFRRGNLMKNWMQHRGNMSAHS